jgi:hypothetical protein
MLPCVYALLETLKRARDPEFAVVYRHFSTHSQDEVSMKMADFMVQKGMM